MLRSLGVGCLVLVLGMSAAWADDDDDDTAKPTKVDKPKDLTGTLYGELGIVFNLLHIPESTADAGFGFRIAAGYQPTSKLRLHVAFRSLSNENKDQPSSEEDYYDLSVGLALALDGKHFHVEGELTLPTISGTGFSEGGFGGGVYFTAGYPLAPQVSVVGRLGAYVASIDIPSRGGRRVPMWGLIGIALVYQGAPWSTGN